MRTEARLSRTAASLEAATLRLTQRTTLAVERMQTLMHACGDWYFYIAVFRLESSAGNKLTYSMHSYEAWGLIFLGTPCKQAACLWTLRGAVEPWLSVETERELASACMWSPLQFRQPTTQAHKCL